MSEFDLFKEAHRERLDQIRRLLFSRNIFDVEEGLKDWEKWIYNIEDLIVDLHYLGLPSSKDKKVLKQFLYHSANHKWIFNKGQHREYIRLWAKGLLSEKMGFVQKKLEVKQKQSFLFPYNFFQWSSLETISLRHMRGVTIPNSFYNLPNLKFLGLENCNLLHISEDLGKLTSLKSLSLCENNLRELPLSLGKLQNLTSLNISCNEFQEMPKEISKLKNLRYFTFFKDAKNPKTPLAPFLFFDALGDLTELESLILFQNYMPRVPTTFKNLTKLRILNLEDCGLEELPEWLGELPNLQLLNIKGHPHLKRSQLPQSLSKNNSLNILMD